MCLVGDDPYFRHHFRVCSAKYSRPRRCRACDFYTNVLGFWKVFENGNLTGFVMDRAELHLNLCKDHKPSIMSLIHIMVDNVDGFLAVCEVAGVGIINALKGQDFGFRVCRSGW